MHSSEGKIETRDSVDILATYWEEIRENKPCSRAEEADLFARIKDGDRSAVDEIVEANLRFVVSIAREFCPKDGPLLMDLIAEGNLGLLSAIDKFDPSRGFKFITYAVWRIRQAILKSLPQHTRAARIPMSHVYDNKQVEKKAAQMGQDLGRWPSQEEIAEKMEMTPDRLRNAMDATNRDLSLDAPAFDEDDTPVIESFALESHYEQVDNKGIMDALNESFKDLDERESTIVTQYFGLGQGDGKTLEEIGGELGVTRERVRQLRNRALAKMREHFDESDFDMAIN